MAVARKIEIVVESTPVSPSKYITDATRYENVTEFIFSNPSSAGVAYEQTNGIVNQWGAGCHGGLFDEFDKKVNYKYLASVCGYNEAYYARNISGDKNKAKIVFESIQEYLEFIFSDESPWKNVHQGTAEIIRDKTNAIRGFILGRDHFQVSEYSGIFNLLLAARLCRYNNWLFLNYHAMRQLGLGILESFILGYYLTPAGSGLFKLSGRTWDGASTCFSEFRYNFEHGKGFYDHKGSPLPLEKRVPSGIIDFKAIKSGEYRFNNIPGQNHISSCGWHKPGDQTQLLSSILSSPSFVQKTAFSQVSLITADRVQEIAKTLFD